MLLLKKKNPIFTFCVLIFQIFFSFNSYYLFFYYLLFYCNFFLFLSLTPSLSVFHSKSTQYKNVGYLKNWSVTAHTTEEKEEI